MKLPTFELSDQNGKIHTSKDYLGKWFVLYVYPRDDTPGCTKEACSFRDGRSEFKKLGVEVVGISKDNVKSHKKFADKFDLNFTILSDPNHKIIEELGAWGRKKFMGREFDGVLRNTYIVDPKGKIVRDYKGVNPKTHSEEVLEDLKELIK